MFKGNSWSPSIWQVEQVDGQSVLSCFWNSLGMFSELEFYGISEACCINSIPKNNNNKNFLCKDDKVAEALF